MLSADRSNLRKGATIKRFNGLFFSGLIVALPGISLGSFASVQITKYSTYAISSWSNYLPDEVIALNGADHSFDELASAGTASSRRQGYINSSEVYLRAMTSSSGRTSAGGQIWYDFVANTSAVKLDYDLRISPLVWWDDVVVNVYDLTKNILLVGHHSLTESGSTLLQVTPGDTLRLYAGVNQNNLYQGAEGSTAFYAEGRLSPVPEPATLAVISLGALSLVRRRKQH